MAQTLTRPVVALYHHLPPGGADRAMYELVRRTAVDFRYILYRIEPGRRDPFHGADRCPIEDVVDDVRNYPSHSGGGSQLGRWGVTVPSIIAAERRIARHLRADYSLDALIVHHQRFLQAPTLLRSSTLPTAYFMQEPRRRSFEYDLRHAARGAGRLLATATAPLEAVARRADISNTRAADVLFCNSEHSREYIWHSYGRDATVIPLGVDETHFVLDDHATRDHEVLAVGSLDPTKGHDLAIDAIARIDTSRRPRLRIVHNRDDPSTRDQLQHQARTNGVDLLLESGVSENELVARYQHARVVVLTGRVEPLGLTALEALACGTPVVAIREGGYRETIEDGVTGLLTNRTPVALAEALHRVLDGSFAPDPALLRSTVLKRYHWDIGTCVYRHAVRDLIAAARPGT